MLRNLTRKQKFIYEYLVKGLSIEEIAKLNGTTKNGVKFHITKIYKKFDVSNRTEFMSKVLWLKEQKEKSEFIGLPMPRNTERVLNAE